MSSGTCIHTRTHNINTNKCPCGLFATLKFSSFNNEVLVCRLCLNPFSLHSHEHYISPGSCLDQDTSWSKLQIIMHVFSQMFLSFWLYPVDATFSGKRSLTPLLNPKPHGPYPLFAFSLCPTFPLTAQGRARRFEMWPLRTWPESCSS